MRLKKNRDAGLCVHVIQGQAFGAVKISKIVFWTAAAILMPFGLD